MIRNSFIFLPKIDRKTEESIWKQGITTWTDFISASRIKGVSQKRKFVYDRILKKAVKALLNSDSTFFLGLPSSENWRLYEMFKDEACYLDIEASGTRNNSFVTVIGIYDGFETKIMVKDVNLDFKQLKKELEKYKLIITFNGSSFDIPFLKKRFPELLPEIPNFDLKTACLRIGLEGGLKIIEKQLGIKRSGLVERLYGGDILLLWKMFRGSRDPYYLDLLIEYNEYDVINLKLIAERVVSELKKQHLKLLNHNHACHKHLTRS
ncbi:exonuclease [Candidatus Woesearchaeota archaeon]|nr:MAG: exonuclease [Candidatus Woesearchaeota archaeon]